MLSDTHVLTEYINYYQCIQILLSNYLRNLYIIIVVSTRQ